MEYFIRDIERDTQYKQVTLEELKKELEGWEEYNNTKWGWYDLYAIRLEKVENGAMYFGVAPNEM